MRLNEISNLICLTITHAILIMHVTKLIRICFRKIKISHKYVGYITFLFGVLLVATPIKMS